MEELFEYLGVFGTPTLPFVVIGLVSLCGLFAIEVFINNKPQHKWNSKLFRAFLRIIMRVFVVAYLLVFLSFMGLQQLSFFMILGGVTFGLPYYLYKSVR